MTDIHAAMTLAEAVDAFPELAREFERRGLDYCCGGGRTLGEACALVGADPDETIAELAGALAVGSDGAVWTTMPADALVDHLETTHHRYLWDELPRVTALVDKIVSVHGTRHPELVDVAACFARIRADLEPHLLKEERVLFPMIRELAGATDRAPAFHCGSLRNPIAVMQFDHERVDELFAELRAVTDGFVVPADGGPRWPELYDGLAELEADTHVHVHEENDLLFPAVLATEAALLAR